jgi:hypothetical protein
LPKRTIEVRWFQKVGLQNFVISPNLPLQYLGLVAVVSAISFYCFWAYYFSETTVVKRISFFYHVCTCCFHFHSSCLQFSKKTITIMKNQRLFCRNCRVKWTTKGSPVITSWRNKVYVEEKRWTVGKVQLTDGTEGWIENSAIKEVK